MRYVALALFVLLAGCGTTMGPGGPGPYQTPSNVPLTGQIAYRCANGAQIVVDYAGQSAQVAIVGGPSMVLPSTGGSDAPTYTNGRYTLRGGGANATWQTPSAAPTECRGN